MSHYPQLYNKSFSDVTISGCSRGVRTHGPDIKLELTTLSSPKELHDSAVKVIQNNSRVSQNKGGEFLHFIASNPNLSVHTMRYLLTKKHTWKHVVITPLIENPSITPELLEYIFNNLTSDSDIAFKVALSPKCSRKMLENILKSSLTASITGALYNPRTPFKLIPPLLFHSDETIRTLAKNRLELGR